MLNDAVMAVYVLVAIIWIIVNMANKDLFVEPKRDEYMPKGQG